MTPVLIVLNAGSSSLKFQVFEARDGGDPSVVFKGLFEGLRRAPARFVAQGSRRRRPRREVLGRRRTDRA